MLSFISNVLGIIKTILNRLTAKDVLYILIIIGLCWLLWINYSNMNKLEDQYKNNVEALKDTVSYYKSKTGELVATKTAFECDIKELEKLNESLHAEIKDLKIKNDVLLGMHVSGKVENPSVDTVFIVKQDSIYKGFKHNFNFNNDWRTLEGYVAYIPDSLGVNITKDEIYFDYTLALDEKNNIYIKSSNPYVKYNEFTGFVIPEKPKPKKFELAIYANLEYKFKLNKLAPIIGTELNYKGFGGFYEFVPTNSEHIIGIGYKFKILNF